MTGFPLRSLHQPTKVELCVREATLDDTATIVEFNRRLAFESEQRVLDRATLQRGIARALTEPDLCRYFLAERDGRVVGQAMITYELTDWRDGVMWWLQSVYVEPPSRRQGVFRALFEHISALARTRSDVRGLRLYVERANRGAMSTYRAVGLKPTGHFVYEIDWSTPTQRGDCHNDLR